MSNKESLFQVEGKRKPFLGASPNVPIRARFRRQVPQCPNRTGCKSARFSAPRWGWGRVCLIPRAVALGSIIPALWASEKMVGSSQLTNGRPVVNTFVAVERRVKGAP